MLHVPSDASGAVDLMSDSSLSPPGSPVIGAAVRHRKERHSLRSPGRAGHASKRPRNISARISETSGFLAGTSGGTCLAAGNIANIDRNTAEPPGWARDTSGHLVDVSRRTSGLFGHASTALRRTGDASNPARASAARPCCGQAQVFGGAVSPRLCPAACPDLSSYTCYPYSAMAVKDVEQKLMTVCLSVDCLEYAAEMLLCYEGRSILEQTYTSATGTMLGLYSYLRCHERRLNLLWKQALEMGIIRFLVRLDPLPQTDTVPSRFNAQFADSHYLLHASMEVRVIAVSILHHLHFCPGYVQDEAISIKPVPWIGGDAPLWLTAAHHLIWQLLARSARRFQELGFCHLLQSSAFPCGCEKSIWIALLQLFQQAELNFWNEVNSVFEFIIGLGKRSLVCDEVSGLVLGLVAWPDWKYLWISWMLLSISDVFAYGTDLKHMVNGVIPANYSLLISMTESAIAIEYPRPDSLNACSSVHYVICGQLGRLWGYCEQLLLLVWNKVWCLLSQSRTSVSCAKLTTLIPSSGSDWLARCRQQPSSGYSLSAHFLWILKSQVSERACDGGFRCLDNLSGRIFLKLHSKKATELEMTALVEVVNIFLVLIELKDDRRLETKLVSFFSLISKRTSHFVVIIRAYFAALRLLAEKQCDTTVILDAVSSLADKMMRSGDCDSQLVAAYMNECDAIFCEYKHGVPLEADVTSLITDGWRVWLLACGPSERARCLKVLLNATSFDGSPRRLKTLVPAIQSIAASEASVAPPAELAQLAAAMTVLSGCCGQSDFSGDAVSPVFSAAYIALLLKGEQSQVDAVLDVDDRVEHEWFRCFVLAPDSAPFKELTRRLANLPQTVSVMPSNIDTGMHNATTNNQLAVEFVQNLRALAVSGQSDKVNAVIGSLDFLRSWMRSAGPKSEAMWLHIYHLFGVMMVDLIERLDHQKTVLIFNTLLLFPAVYDADRRLSAAQSAGVAGSLRLFLTGLSTASAKGEHPFYTRCFKDIIMCYIHRFPHASHPFLDFLSCSQVSFGSKRNFVGQATRLLVHTRPGWHRPSLLVYVRVVRQLLSALSRVDSSGGETGSAGLAGLVAEQTAGPLLECLLNLEDPQTKRAITEVVSAMGEDRSELTAAALCSAVEAVVRRHLAFSSTAVMRLLELLCVLAAPVMRSLVTTVQSTIAQIEVKRGVGRDVNLRQGLKLVQRRLGLPTEE